MLRRGIRTATRRTFRPSPQGMRPNARALRRTLAMAVSVKCADALVRAETRALDLVYSVPDDDGT